MKMTWIMVVVAVWTALPAFAVLNIPSDGSDGALTVTTNTVIDLSQAVTGVWSNNNAANAGKGIYDSNKWAVVFKYRSVNVSTGATVTFKNHRSRAPVVWLVQSNVMVGANGGINLTGQKTGFLVATNLDAGPGGFRSGSINGSALGPGGAVNSNATFKSTYGNLRLLPLIGGSGVSDLSGTSLAAGGGAILIAAGNSVTNNGTIQSVGLNGLLNYASGGGIRIACDALMGNGAFNVQPDGRLRVEANSVSGSLTFSPIVPVVAPGDTPAIWPLPTAPVCTIVSVGGTGISSDPTADFGNQPDAVVESQGPVDVILETRNFPTSGVVKVRVAPKTNTNTIWVTASYQSGNTVLATWRASVPLTNTITMLQARAVSQ
jgi:hypothetical protein